MDNFIEIYKKAFSDDFCNKVIEIFDQAEECGMSKNRQEHEGTTPKLHKDDESTFLPDYGSEVYMKHLNQGIYGEFNGVFWGHCYKEYADKYSILQKLKEHYNYIIKVQKTRPGQGYHSWHCEHDSIITGSRLLTWTVYLNDDFEAGETEFLYQQYRYKPSKGDCVIFPAAFTHTHRGNPPIGGDKYIITGWVEF